EVAALGLIHQAREHRIAIHAWEAGPDDVGVAGHEGGYLAVADQAELKIHVRSLSLAPWMRSGRTDNPCSTSLTESAVQRAADPAKAPTRMVCPPRWLTRWKASSSVTSSPMNTGLRPTNGGSFKKLATTVPLS